MRVALGVLAVVAAMWWLRAASGLLIPIAIAVCISYALEPIVQWGSRYMPRLLAASVLLLDLAGTFAWGAYTLRDDVTDAVHALPQAASRVRQMVAAPRQDGLVAEIRQAAAELRKAAADAQGTKVGGADPEPQPGTGGPASNASAPGTALTAPANLVSRSVSSGFTLLGDAVTVFFLLFFLLASGDHFSRRIIEVASGADQRETVRRIMHDINAQVQRFLLVRLATAIVVALATWGALAWLGTANAAVWGVMAGVFNSIPYFGPVLVSGGLLLIGLVQSGELTKALEMSGSALLITSLEGWLLTPPLLGKAERMDATVIFVGLLLWTWLWGAWGTLLAVPMLVALKAVADHVEPLKPLSRLMAP